MYSSFYLDCYNDVINQVMPLGSSWPVKNGDGECSMCTCGENGIAECGPRIICGHCDGEERPNPGQCCPKCGTYKLKLEVIIIIINNSVHVEAVQDY